MVTLYKRATAPQARMLRAISGAVMNVAHAHPELGLTEKNARSIAKRATGTLTAQWPDVLAAKSVRGFQPSPSGGLTTVKADRKPSHAAKAAKSVSSGEGGRGMSQISRHPPISSIIKDLSNAAGAARKADDLPRWNALVDALRIIDRHMKK